MGVLINKLKKENMKKEKKKGIVKLEKGKLLKGKE